MTPRNGEYTVAVRRRRAGVQVRVRWELVDCALQGHRTVGHDVAEVRGQDALVLREDAGGVRWHRCLRCDAWLPASAPTAPTRATLPPLHALELPLRGRPLRDRWVLRLIAVDRVVHVLGLGLLATGVLVFSGNRGELDRWWRWGLAFAAEHGVAVDTAHGLLSTVSGWFDAPTSHLTLLGALLVGYAALEAAEAVGLWQGTPLGRVPHLRRDLRSARPRGVEPARRRLHHGCAAARGQPRRGRLPAARQAPLRAARRRSGRARRARARRRVGGPGPHGATGRAVQASDQHRRAVRGSTSLPWLPVSPAAASPAAVSPVTPAPSLVSGTILDDLPLRDDLRGHAPYGAPQLEVAVRLNTNENSHDVPPAVVERIVAALAEQVPHLNRYPDREADALRDALASFLNGRPSSAGAPLTRGNVWAANGSNEVLQQLLQAFGGPGRTAVGFTPSYSMHPIITQTSGTRWVDGGRGEDFTLDLWDVAEQVEAAGGDGRRGADVVFLTSPNNPTGTALPLDVVEAAYTATSGIVVVDEAYAEFARAGTPSALSLLPGRPAWWSPAR